MQVAGAAHRVGLTALAQGLLPARGAETAEQYDELVAAILKLMVSDHGFRGRRVVSCVPADGLTISQYLVALRETDLFERVTLSFTGQHTVREETWRKFEVRLQVKNPEALLDHAPATVRRITKESRSRETAGASR